MELRHLRYFIAVAEELHFGRAAAKVGIAQPPLSQQIRALELEIGIMLFQRTKRRVQLTEPGRVFLEAARAALDAVERAVEAARQAGRGQVGRLAVGFVPWADFTEFPRIIRLFGERHPDVKLELDGVIATEQIAALRAGRLDVGFTRPPLSDGALLSEPLLSEPIVVVFPVGHRFAKFRRVPMVELVGESCILLARRRAPVFYDHIVALCRAAGYTLEARQEVDQPQTLIGLVAAGLGISLVPATFASVARRGVAHRWLDPPGAELQTIVAWRGDDASPVVQEFLSVVREVTAEGRRRGGRRDGDA